MEDKLLQGRFDQMTKTGTLFISSVEGDVLWREYLKGFGNDPIYRDPASSVHNCNNCHNFIRRYGRIVALD